MLKGECAEQFAALLLYRKHKEQKVEWTKGDLTCGVYCCSNLKARLCTVFKYVTFSDSLQPVNK
jgi:hypothetical protein